MSTLESGSQSKAVVLVSSLFLLVLSLACAWILYEGGDPDSMFPLLKNSISARAIGLLGFVLFGWIALIGFLKKKLPRN